MPPDLDRRLRPRMTLRQFGVLVIFVAIALAVVLPIGRSTSRFRDTALLAAAELPYVLLLPVLFLVRRGPIKSWIAATLCCVPLAAVLIFVNYLGATVLWSDGLSRGEILALGMLGLADLGLLAVLAALGNEVVPRVCPECGRRAMLRDPSVPRSRDFPKPREARSCLACGSRFRRARRGPWVDVDLLDGRSGRPALTPTPAIKDDPR